MAEKEKVRDALLMNVVCGTATASVSCARLVVSAVCLIGCVGCVSVGCVGCARLVVSAVCLFSCVGCVRLLASFMNLLGCVGCAQFMRTVKLNEADLWPQPPSCSSCLANELKPFIPGLQGADLRLFTAAERNLLVVILLSQ